MIRFHLISRSVFGLLLIAAMGSEQALAQVFRAMRTTQSARFIEAPRFIEQELGDAEDAIAEKQFSDAVVRLGDLLQREADDALDADSLAGQDFFLIENAQQRIQHQTKSLLRRARTMIGKLPPAALDTYELQYGPLARRTFDEASASRDWDALRSVRRKFFHTKAGYEASLILAQKELFDGHPLSASLLLDAIVETPRAVQHLGDAVKELHAASMQLSGRTEDSGPIGYEIKKQAVGGKSVDYAMFGSSPDRNGGSAGQMPLGNLRWDLPTTASPREEQLLLEKSEDLLTGGKLPAPSWMPIRVGDQLLMRTTDRLFGVNYRTGKRVWQFPWYASAEDIDEEEFPVDLIGTMPGDDEPGNLLTQRVWNDLPYGQVTSDGTRVFMITDLAEIEIAQFSPIMGIRGARPADTRTNTLVALDLATEGKLQWRLGKSADQASTLSDAFFLGAPLPLDGYLYVMAEMAGDILLLCLDPASGEEVWRQQLVAVETGSVDFDAVRRVAGAAPTYHEGVLICPTGAGATVAIDLVDRMLRWGVSYPRKSDANQIINSRNSLEPNQLMQRWHSGLAVAVDKSVFMTPIESDRLYCFDLVEGTPVFKDRPREQMRYLAGVREGRFLLVGQQEVRAYDSTSGALEWETPDDFLVTGQQISGRGVFGDSHFFVPTTGNQIIQISLSDGQVVSRRSTRYPLGNLVAIDGEIISQSATRLSVAYGEFSLEPLVNSILEKNPNDFDALVRKAELSIERGQLRDAMKLLSRAGEIDDESDEVHLLSIAAMLGILRGDPGGEDDIIARLDQMIDDPGQRAEFLGLLVRGALSNKKYEDAAIRIQEMSALLAKGPNLASAADDIINDISRECSLDSWLAARMQEIVTAVDESQMDRIGASVREYVESNSKGVDSILIRNVRHFDAVDASAARAVLASRYIDDGSYIKLERLALGTSNARDAELVELSDDRLLMLAEAFIQGGRGEDCQAIVKILRSRDDFSDNEKLDQLQRLAESNIRAVEWDETVGLQWQERQLRRGMVTPEKRLAQTLVTWGKSLSGWRLVSEGANSVAVRNPFGQVYGIPLDGLARRDDHDKEAIISGGVMVVVRPGEIAAVDLYSVEDNQSADSIMWQRNFNGDGASIASRTNEMNSFGAPVFWYRLNSPTARKAAEFRVGPILGDRVMMLQGGDLMAIDLMSGQTLWRNAGAPMGGTIVADKDRVAVVSPYSEEIRFFNKLDGVSLNTEPWEYGKIWHSVGKYVLCEVPTSNRRRSTVRIVDPFSGEVLQELETSTASRAIQDGERTFGQVVGSRYMVLLNNLGKLRVWDIQEGTVLADLDTTPFEDLQKVHAMALDGQIIVIPERKAPTLPEAVTLQTRDIKAGHRTAHGLYAVSTDDGSLRWSVEFDKEPWGCTLQQPTSSPVILLARAWSKYSETNERSRSLDVQAIDVTNGKLLHERLGVATSSRSTEIETRITVQPAVKKLIAQVSGSILTYHFGRTDEEVNGDR